MTAALPSQLSPGTVGMVQWTLVGIEVLVLAWVVAWLGRDSRLGRVVRSVVRGFVRRFRRRTALAAVSPESAVALGGARPTRLVSAGGGTAEPMRPATPAPRDESRTPRSLRLTHTPARGQEAVAKHVRAPSALHCPGCGALLVRGEVAARLVTRCPGCERRVAVRLDGDRVVVTLEG